MKVREAERQFAQSTYERWRDSPKGVVSVQEQENKQSDYNSAIARLNSASADVDADQGDVDRLLALAGFKNITAPFDGVVTARETDIGALINAGSGTGGGPELFRVADIHKMRIYVQVPQQMSAGIRSGLTADLRLPQYPDKTFKAECRHHIERHQPQCAHAAGRALRGKSGRPAAARRLRAGRFRAADQSQRGAHPDERAGVPRTRHGSRHCRAGRPH